MSQKGLARHYSRSAWPRLRSTKAERAESAEKTRCQACVLLSFDGIVSPLFRSRARPKARTGAVIFT